MRTAVGVALRNGSVTVAVLKARKTVRIDTLLTGKAGEGPEGPSLSEVLRDIWRRGELAGESVVAALDAKDCILRRIIVPFTNEEKIRRVIRFEAENYLHACAIEDVVVDFLKVDRVGDKSGLLLVAARKETVADRLKLLAEADIDPEILDLDCIALFNAYSLTPQWCDKGQVVLLDVGPEAVRLVLVSDGALKKVRAFRVQATARKLLGGDRLLAAPPQEELQHEEAAAEDPELDSLQQRFAELDRDSLEDSEPIALLDEEELELLKQAPPEEADWRPLFERIMAEAQRTFATDLLGAGLKAVYMTGPGALAPAAVPFFEEAFEAPVELLDFSSLFEDEPPPPAEIHGGDTAVAVGLALRGVEAAPAGLDFRRDEFRYEKRFARLRIPLLFTGLLLFAALFLNCVYLKLEQTRHTLEYHNVRAAQELLYKATFEEDPPKNVNLVSLVRKKWQSLKSLVGEGGAGMSHFVPIVKLLDDVGRAVKKSGVPNLVWRKIYLITEISRPASAIAGKIPQIKAGSITLLWDPDPTTADKIRKAIDENSQYVTVTTYNMDTDRKTGKTLGRLDLKFKDSFVEKVLKGRSGGTAGGRVVSGRFSGGSGGYYAAR